MSFGTLMLSLLSNVLTLTMEGVDVRLFARRAGASAWLDIWVPDVATGDAESSVVSVTCTCGAARASARMPIRAVVSKSLVAGSNLAEPDDRGPLNLDGVELRGAGGYGIASSGLPQSRGETVFEVAAATIAVGPDAVLQVGGSAAPEGQAVTENITDEAAKDRDENDVDNGVEQVAVQVAPEV